MNYILGGGGFSSRLVEEIRIKRGLAYSVTSYFDAGKYPGSFQIVLQTKNSSAREAISIALQQMERIRKESVSEKELEGAKKYLIGSFPLRLDTQGKLASFITRLNTMVWDSIMLQDIHLSSSPSQKRMSSGWLKNISSRRNPSWSWLPT